MEPSEWTILTLKEHIAELRKEDKEALRSAFEAAKEKSLAHNELIREGQRKEALYVTKAELRSSLTAAFGLITAIAAVIGVVVYFVGRP